MECLGTKLGYLWLLLVIRDRSLLRNIGSRIPSEIRRVLLWIGWLVVDREIAIVVGNIKIMTTCVLLGLIERFPGNVIGWRGRRDLEGKIILFPRRHDHGWFLVVGLARNSHVMVPNAQFLITECLWGQMSSICPWTGNTGRISPVKTLCRLLDPILLCGALICK